VEINVAQKQKLDCAVQLTRTVAVDFNNTLTTILGHTSYVLGRMEPDHPWRFSLGEVEKAAEKAAEIANDLAAFSIEEKDKRAQHAGNLTTIVRRAVQLFETPECNHLVWSLEFESKMFAVRFDEAKLQQAFVKVLENAVEAIGVGGHVNGQVRVQTRNLELDEPGEDAAVRLGAGTYVCVEIADDGCGIAPSDVARIFEPFFTTKENRRGLGLAWVYGIVTNHGGGVAVSSEQGKGTSVRIYLPAIKKIVEEEVGPVMASADNTIVLIVDDEEMVVTLGQMILTAAGYKVLTANSGDKALEVLSTESPVHLLITDMVMPSMNGRELRA
jgi:signal transduction histidine kinase